MIKTLPNPLDRVCSCFSQARPPLFWQGCGGELVRRLPPAVKGARQHRRHDQHRGFHGQGPAARRRQQEGEVIKP